MLRNTDVKPVKTFLRKWLNAKNLTYFGAQNGPEIEPLGAHDIHIAESTSNKHIKQKWCESRGRRCSNYIFILHWTLGFNI